MRPYASPLRTLGGLVVSLAVFLAFGELVARAVDVVDRLNGYSRLLYARGTVPSLPYGLRPGVTTMLLGVPVHVNRLGFRGPEVSPQPRAGTRRILVLGDSVVFGLGVRDEETVTAAMQRRYDAARAGAVEVVNLGVPGYNATTEVELLATTGLGLRPSAIVVGVSLNDYDRVPAYGALGVLTRDERPGITGHSEFLLALRWLAGYARGELWQQMLAGEQAGRERLDRSVEASHVAFYRAPSPAAWDELAAAWRRLADVASAHRLDVLVIVFPEGWQIGRPEPDLTPQRRLLELCRQTGLRHLDLQPRFAAAGGALFQDAQHPNARGLEIAAAAIVEALP